MSQSDQLVGWNLQIRPEIRSKTLDGPAPDRRNQTLEVHRLAEGKIHEVARARRFD
jgi:hypothetical protein